jgi:caffeoyl-CoA O-methyltransferase
MKGIVEPKTENYLNALLPRRDRVMAEMERYAARHKVPIVGPACARMLYQLARLAGARRVFELGSAIGYSTAWLALAVGPYGMVYYTDNSPANVKRARKYLRRLGLHDRVRFLTGEALQLLQATDGPFDLIFNDVHKLQYPEVFRIAVPRLRPGGLFISDNVLLEGRAARVARPKDAARAIQEFNRLLYRSEELFTTIIPLRDGLAVCMKRAGKGKDFRFKSA